MSDQIKERQDKLEQMVQGLLDEAQQQGASAAEAAVSNSAGLSVSVRQGEVETIEHNRDQGLGITVYFGQRKGSASTSDFRPEAISQTIQAACNIARYTSEDPYAGLADAELMASQTPDLALYHPWSLSAEEAITIGQECEAGALNLDARINNSDGINVNSHSGLHVYANSHGFVGGNPSSRHSISCSVIGGHSDKMQRDHWYTLARDPALLESAQQVGEKAGQRTLARLGARKIKTQQSPVVIQADIASGLLSSLTGAINGSALYRQASFLLDHLGKQVFPEFIQIYERPRIQGGLASASFDSEGVATYDKDIVRDGILESYLLSSYSARKLGMQTTANAGGVHNLSIDSGEQDLAGLLKQMDTGLLVTQLMGQGLNRVTGDYSRGASGFWVEQGEIQYPVEEITIAGNLKQMFSQLLAVGNDVDRRSSLRTGSWLIESMTIAGN